MKRLSWLIIVFFFSMDLCDAQESRIEKTDQFFNILSDYELANGSIAISLGGTIEYQRAIGFSRIQQGQFESSAIQTNYRIGSVTKMFTAVIVFQLIEEGRLNLDETLDMYFPIIPSSEEISISDMLYHRSGLANYTEDRNFDDWKTKLQPKEELVRIISEMTPVSDPGSGNRYSNSNYLLLSYIIEAITGKSYPQVLNERIFTRIGMPETYFESESDTAQRDSRSYKYSRFNWEEQQDDVAANHSGAGALVSTPTDLIKFVDMLFTGHLISDRSLQAMTSFMGDYGMGIFAFNYGNQVAYGHEGRINEYYTTLIHFPNSELSIAYVTNGVVYPPVDIIDDVSKIWLEEPFSLPAFDHSNLLPEKSSQYTGMYRSDSMSITVTGKVVNDQLVIETAGTDFATVPYGDHKFVNIEYGYFFEFDSTGNELTIKEVDNRYLLRKMDRN